MVAHNVTTRKPPQTRWFFYFRVGVTIGIAREKFSNDSFFLKLNSTDFRIANHFISTYLKKRTVILAIIALKA
jgi:hypothetical protein